MSKPDHVQRYLSPGERVVWRQQAHPKAIRRARIGGLVFLGIGSAFLVIMLGNVVRTDLPGARGEAYPDALGIAMAVFIGVILSVWLRFTWGAAVTLRRGGDTHYALTTTRLLVVDGQGMTEYKPAVFARMQAPGADMLMFDWGEGRGRYRKASFRATLLGLDDAPALEALIRATFGLTD